MRSLIPYAIMATMEQVGFSGLLPAVAAKIRPMIDEIIAAHTRNLHSIHIVGSAVIPDYNEKLSDINSVVVLHAMDLEFIKFLAPLGGKYGRKKIAAPLVMTPEYIRTSLDTFPVEFLDFKLIHKTVYGEDLFRNIEVSRQYLRIQCEREIKVKLIGLRQGYLSSLGRKEQYAAMLARSFTGSMVLLRAVITLLGKEPPVPRLDVITMFSSSTGIGAAVFEKLLMLKAGSFKPPEHELQTLFEQYYQALEAIGKIIDDLPA